MIIDVSLSVNKLMHMSFIFPQDSIVSTNVEAAIIDVISAQYDVIYSRGPSTFDPEEKIT